MSDESRDFAAQQRRASRFVDGPEEFQFTGYVPPGEDKAIPLDEVHRKVAGERHKSSSREQQAAEADMLRALSSDLGVELNPRRCDLNDCNVEVDGYGKTGDSVILVECYARIGRLKPAQRKKIDSDILKLALCAENLHGVVRCIIAFADAEAAASYDRGWRRSAAKWARIEVRVVAVSEDTKSKIIAAQKRQFMTNRADDVDRQ